MKRLPTLFLAHGGGPLPVIGTDPGHMSLAKFLKTVHKQHVVQKPEGIVLISAHWESAHPTVTSSPSPELIYDYYGFPPHSYDIKYPSKGSPLLANRITNLLLSVGINCQEDPQRGLDHGAFIPLSLIYENADIPVVQISLVSNLDPELHFKIGEAISPLRDEGIIIIGSGMSVHNMSVFQSAMKTSTHPAVDPKTVEFDEFLQEAVLSTSYEEMKKKLVNWKQAKSALYAHPREEHLIPLMVVAGASNGDVGSVIHSEPLLGALVSSFKFSGS